MFTNIIERQEKMPYPLSTLFTPIHFNNDIFVSIQASSIHSSVPKVDFGNACDYLKYELLIESNDIPKYMKEYSKSGVYDFVPKEVVHNLIEYYHNKYGFYFEVDSNRYTNKLKNS